MQRTTKGEEKTKLHLRYTVEIDAARQFKDRAGEFAEGLPARRLHNARFFTMAGF